ncbi:MAG: aminotransferase class I/II-fold pyridoxal phosphate-dependent enzyme [Candidatus Heimdallarchaeota archaeon]|nr:aminotransferase class I/II-fold pyridoxal phosphate-dependent enzyme [Candidatus Heimdallarchaeota archaeon]MCK5143770.1 aminotransferase class I/II-fold pyridoxal phosphate-dependent enzyme [Candidatus Heimdallarchaeota archaeon]
MIDLRSDTFTLPSKEMLETILTAKLGDDVWEEDPTVKELEALAAKKLGKEAGLLVSSGTQGNLVSNMTHLNRGDGVVLEKESHIYLYEVGGLSQLIGGFPFLIEGNNGLMDPKDVEAIFTRGYNVHWVDPKLLCLENTHNRGGGKIIPKENIDQLAKIAHENNGLVHMDGARVFNAAVATGMAASKIVENADSVQICLSKGLGCPVGSVIAGSEEFINKARRQRKLVGGGLRQAGIIAAPGIYALNNMIDRLAEDHKHARMLEKALIEIEELKVKPVDTNIAVVDTSASKWSAAYARDGLEKHGIKVTYMGDQFFRMVTYFGITTEDVEQVVSVIPEVFK